MRLALVALLLAATPVLAQPDGNVRAMEGALLRGDGVAARSGIVAARSDRLTGKERAYVSCVSSRLQASVVADQGLPPFTSKALAVYRSYWQRHLNEPQERESLEPALRKQLSELLGVPNTRDFPELEAGLQKRFASDGFFALMGVTPPMRELMLWRVQTARMFDVSLPAQRYPVRVVMTDRFVSLGWTGWATCSNRSTGGWATDTTLYAVMPRYPGGEGSNLFLAVLLTHETQHFADKNRYSKLLPWELEYRAKLAELWAADVATATERLAKFSDSQSDDTSLAHPYANRRVIAMLTKRMGRSPLGVDVSALRSSAAALLAQDSANRERMRVGLISR